MEWPDTRRKTSLIECWLLQFESWKHWSSHSTFSFAKENVWNQRIYFNNEDLWTKKSKRYKIKMPWFNWCCAMAQKCLFSSLSPDTRVWRCRPCVVDSCYKCLCACLCVLVHGNVFVCMCLCLCVDDRTARYIWPFLASTSLVRSEHGTTIVHVTRV